MSLTSHFPALIGGFFTISPSGNFGNGTSQNTFSYADSQGNTYRRQVSSINTNITFDHQGGTLAPKQALRFPTFGPSALTIPQKLRRPGKSVVGN